MDNRKISEKYSIIGEQLINNNKELEYIKNSKATIIFLTSEHEKKQGGNKTLGQCEKIANKYKWGIPCDFTITLFLPNIVGLNDKQIEILLLHELLHIGITDGKDGNEVYTVKPHDLEDFKYIIDNYGTEWSKTDE